MSSPYTGNSVSAQSPSPAPSLGNTTGGDPIGSLPADGDPDAASTFNQAYKVALDWIAYFRRVIPTNTVINALIAAAQSAAALATPADISADYGSASGSIIKNGMFTEILFGLDGVPYNFGTPIVSFTGAANTALNGKTWYLMVNATPNTVPDNYTCKAHQVTGGSDQVNVQFRFEGAIDLGHVYNATGRIIAW